MLTDEQLQEMRDSICRERGHSWANSIGNGGVRVCMWCNADEPKRDPSDLERTREQWRSAGRSDGEVYHKLYGVPPAAVIRHTARFQSGYEEVADFDAFEYETGFLRVFGLSFRMNWSDLSLDAMRHEVYATEQRNRIRRHQEEGLMVKNTEPIERTCPHGLHVLVCCSVCWPAYLAGDNSMINWIEKGIALEA